MIRLLPKNKFRRRLAWTITILLLSGFFLHIASNVALGIWWRGQIESINRQPGGQYHIQSKTPHINLFTGSLSLKKFHLSPAKGLAEGEAPPLPDGQSRFKIDLSSLKVMGIDPIAFIFKKKISIDRIILSAGTIELIPGEAGTSPKNAPSTARSVVLKIPLTIRSLHVGKMIFDSIHMITPGKNPSMNRENRLVVSTELNHLTAAFTETEDGRSRMLPASISGGFTDTGIILPDGMYKIEVGDVKISAEEGELSLKDIALLPRYEKGHFARKRGYRATRATLNVRDIRLRFTDLFSILTDKEIMVEDVWISGVNLKMYRDKRIPRRSRRKSHLFPHAVLRRLPIKVALKKGKIVDGSVEYVERAEGIKNPGRLYFTNATVSFENLYNHRSLNAEEKPFVVDARAQIMGQTMLNTHFGLDLLNPNDGFRFEGGVTGMDGRILNPFLKISSMQVAAGRVRSLRFAAAGNRYGASGTMRIKYNDLKISILSKRKPGKRKGIPSFLANRVIISNNPRKNRPLRLGSMSFRREEQKPIFDLIWRSVLAGIKSSVGVSKAKKR